MGTGMATYLAGLHDINHLYLIAPFTSLSDIKDDRFVPIPDVLMKYNFDNLASIDKVRCPVTVFHSPEDNVIPFDHSKKIAKAFPNKVTFISLPAISHRRTIFNEIVSNTIRNGVVK